jgi:hypothetical protein
MLVSVVMDRPTGLHDGAAQAAAPSHRASTYAVDPVDRDERRVDLEARQDADDGLREVLIEGEQARHVRALSCCRRRVQVLCELPLQVESVLDRRRLYVCI